MRNTGKQGFEDISASSGISAATGQYVSWGSGIYDFDNDGWLDILVFHGGICADAPRSSRSIADWATESLLMFRVMGCRAHVKTVARGACFGDYDNDGKVDAFLVNLGAPGTLLHNISQSKNHWLTVTLKGTKSNRDGVGARVELIAGEHKQRLPSASQDPDIFRKMMIGCTSALAPLLTLTC